MEIFDRLKNICEEQLLLQHKEMKFDSHLIYDLGADSLDLVEVILVIEEEFDISIPDEEIIEEELLIKNIIKIIEEKLKEKQ